MSSRPLHTLLTSNADILALEPSESEGQLASIAFPDPDQTQIVVSSSSESAMGMAREQSVPFTFDKVSGSSIPSFTTHLPDVPFIVSRFSNRAPRKPTSSRRSRLSLSRSSTATTAASSPTVRIALTRVGSSSSRSC